MRYKGKIYKRIMLLGNSGSGKSWTAQRLGEKTGYPVIYLDKECWQPRLDLSSAGGMGEEKQGIHKRPGMDYRRKPS